MRNKISGVLGILCGSGLLAKRLLAEPPITGYETPLGLALVMLVAGVYYLFKKP